MQMCVSFYVCMSLLGFFFGSIFFFLFTCFVIFWFVLFSILLSAFFFLVRERKGVDLSGCEGWERKNYNQNILHEKIFFNKRSWKVAGEDSVSLALL